MRIGMMTDVYKPYVSGVTNYISLNKKAFEQVGHEVYVFTFGDSGVIDDETNIIRSPGIPLIYSGFYLSVTYNTLARRLLGTMDVVHVQHPFLSGSIAWRFCRPRGIPIVFTNHTRYDLYAQAYIPILGDAIGIPMLQAYLPVFCRACDLVIAPSNGIRQVLSNLGVDAPIQVIPNGVNLEPFINDRKQLDRSIFGFTPDNVVLIYVGRLGPEKNLPFLLRCFAGTTHAYDHVRLVIAGDGPQRNDLHEQVNSLGIGSKVHFAGWVAYDELPGYLAMADAFVTASVTESHPLSVIEAMAAGLPVLGIDSPGVGDTVEDNLTGFLATQDPTVFTAKMGRIVTDNALRKSMGERARLASKDYAIERTSTLVEEQYKRLIKQATGRKRGLRSRLTRILGRRQ